MRRTYPANGRLDDLITSDSGEGSALVRVVTPNATPATSSLSRWQVMDGAYAGDLSKLYRDWTGDRVDELNATTTTRMEGALRAALDL